TIAAFFLETVTGTNGVLIPPDGYLQGVRELCDRYGILMVCDEIMSGFGRTGAWFAVDHWKVVPDIITMAKGLTSSYVPLEPLAPFNGTSDEMKAIAKYFREHGLYTFLRWHSIMTNPPLCITEDELNEGFAIIDKALDLADQGVRR